MATAKINIIALENIKYDGKYRTPGTDSAKFSCAKKHAEKLIEDGQACLPQTIEERNQPAGQKEANKIIAEAETAAKKIISDAETKAGEIIKAAEARATEITSGTGNE